MRVVVLCGVPGAGKTFLRQTDEGFVGLPAVDIKQVYEGVPGISWDAAVYALVTRAGKLLIRNGGTVILEGMFLPGTPSRKLLKRELESMMLDAEFVFVHRSLEACQRGVMANSRSAYELRKRREILAAYWQRAEEIWQRQ